MKRLTLLLALLPILGFAPAFAWDEIWEPGIAIVEEYKNKEAIQGRYLMARNKGGTTLSDGQVVLWNSGAITVSDATTGVSNIGDLPIANNLSTEGGWHYFVITGEARPNAGTFTVSGIDRWGKVAVEDVAFATGTTDVSVRARTKNLWQSITSIAGDGIIDGSYTFIAYCPNAVSGDVGNDDSLVAIAGIVVSDAAGNKGAGVVADNEECIVQYAGVAIAAVTDTLTLPGSLLATDADDEGLDITSNTDHRAFGIALEPVINAGDKIRILINR